MYERLVFPLLVAFCLSTTSVFAKTTGNAEVKEVIADFTESTKVSERRKMHPICDNLMGGTSHATQAQETEFLLWKGTVEIFSSIGKAGFCDLFTAGKQSFPQNLAEFSGISYVVRKSSSQMLTPMSVEIRNGYVTDKGVHLVYTAELEEHSSDNDEIEFYAPWSRFTATDLKKQFPSAPKLDDQGLKRIYTIGLSSFTSHTAGDFNLEIMGIYATNKSMDNMTIDESPLSAGRLLRGAQL